MLSFALRCDPLRLAEGVLAHTEHLPWLVAAVRPEAEYAGIAESAALVQSFDAYPGDGWEVLRTCGVLKPDEVARTRMRTVYAGGHVAFYPTAFLSSETALELRLAPRMSEEELLHHNERVLAGLSKGRYAVSKAARDALGNGYSAALPPSDGVGELSVMELALSNGSSVLGWGWVWHPHK